MDINPVSPNPHPTLSLEGRGDFGVGISIIIVSWNVRDLLKKCLESIFRHANGATSAFGLGYAKAPMRMVSFEIIVVDNASSDGTVEMLKQNFNVIPSERSESRNPLYENKSEDKGSLHSSLRSSVGMTINIIQNQTNKGFAAANNQGIREAKGEFVLLLNPDTEFIEDTLSKVVEKMRLDPSIGVLGCKLLNPDRTIQPSVRRFPGVRDIFVMLFKLHKVWPGLLDRYLMRDFSNPHPTPLPGRERGLSYGPPPASEVDQVMGAFFCVRKSLFDKIGLLDEGYFIWFEEVDFCRRAQAAGYKVVYWPGTSVVHHGGQSFAQQMTWKKQWWFFKSAWRYFVKH